MKRTFLARRNALLTGQVATYGAFALAFAVLALLVRLIAPNFFWTITTPLFRASDAVSSGVHGFLSSFGNAVALTEQNEKLIAENAALASENQALIEKNASLTTLLGVSSAAKNISGVLAGVVARPPASPYDTLVVAAGSKQGVVLGMEAFGESGIPIGFVSSVLDDFSRVTLFSAPGVTTNGWVGKADVPVSLSGAGGGALSASIARAANITQGDIVYVPGPGQLPIGNVARIDSDPLSPGVTLRIQLASNPFSLSWVTLRATGSQPSSLATSTPL